MQALNVFESPVSLSLNLTMFLDILRRIQETQAVVYVTQENLRQGMFVSELEDSNVQNVFQRRTGVYIVRRRGIILSLWMRIIVMSMLQGLVVAEHDCNIGDDTRLKVN